MSVDWVQVSSRQSGSAASASKSAWLATKVLTEQSPTAAATGLLEEMAGTVSRIDMATASWVNSFDPRATGRVGEMVPYIK